jgi:hypothetical protein
MSAESSTPVVAASAARTLPWSRAIHVRGRRASAGFESVTLGECLGIDVRLQEAVEKHECVGSGLVQPQRKLAEGTEVRAQLDGDRHRDRRLHASEDIDVAFLHVAAGDARVTREVVDVQLDRGGACVLHQASVVRPSFWGDPVEARDDWNVGGGRGTLDEAEVTGGAGVVLDDGRYVIERLGEALGRAVDDLRSARFLLAQLLLEERVQNDRADPGIGETPNSIERVRER